MDGNVVAAFYFCGKPHHVPVGQANATVTGRTTNRIRLVGSVNANALLVEGAAYHKAANFSL